MCSAYTDLLRVLHRPVKIMDTEQEGVVHDVQPGEELHVGRECVQQGVLALVSDTDLQTVRKEVIVLGESRLSINKSNILSVFNGEKKDQHKQNNQHKPHEQLNLLIEQ